MVKREQALQCGSVDFGGEENVTKGCVARNNERKALPRIGVWLYECEIGYELQLLTKLKWWRDELMIGVG